MPRKRPLPLIAKTGATAALILLVESVIADASILLPLAALGWIVALAVTRPVVRRDRQARVALACALLFVATMVDDPGPLGVLLFLVAMVMAALLPRRRFDHAIAWALRIAWLGIAAIALPLRDLSKLTAVRQRRRAPGVSIAGIATALLLPVAGGALFLALFASANPLIGRAFASIVLPGPVTVIWRSLVAGIVLLTVWATLRPLPHVTLWTPAASGPVLPQPGAATLILSLATFNAIFAVQNALDIAFLWSGAALPAGVTMADYAHRGAYALIVTALLAGLFVLVTLRPGSAGAASPTVRRLVTIWILQNLLLVASSALRTLDYVAVYSMTALRLAALIWMALVAVGLALILWRLLRGRSATWLVNANAFAAALVLTACTIVDLGATAAAWNVRVAIAQGGEAAPDTCYLQELGTSALVPLARLELQTRDPAMRDRIASLRWNAQRSAMISQTRWNGWTWRNARRLAAVQALLGAQPPRLWPSPYGRTCGVIDLPPPPPPAQLTKAPQR